MADQRTENALKWRRRLRDYLPAVAAAIVGLALKLFFGFSPIEALLQILEPLTGIAPRLTFWLTRDPTGTTIAGWVAGPGALFILVLGVSRLPPFRTALAWLISDPPGFVSGDLEALRQRTMTNLERTALPFAGRRPERATLRAMLTLPDDREPFQWAFLLGVSGIGKSRLAIEWLAEARLLGWDVGFLDHSLQDRLRLASWRPRRPTALVIDDARTYWDRDLAKALFTLSKSATKRWPVRVLVVDQVTPPVHLADAEEREPVRRAQLPTIRLAGLDLDEVAEMFARAASDAEVTRLLTESAGRPRAAIILSNLPDAANYAEALSDWAERLFPDIMTEVGTPAPGVAIPLVFAALAGPIETDKVRAHMSSFDAGAILPYFEDARREDLERRIPELRPEDLAQEVLLRLLSRIDLPARTGFVRAMVADAPERVETRLGAIWGDRRELATPGARSAELTAILRWLQATFDELCPERVEAVRRRAAELAELAAAAGSVGEAEHALWELSEIAKIRPFDLQIRRSEANAAAGAIHLFGKSHAWDQLEHWGKLMADRADDARIAADLQTRRSELAAALHAMHHYARTSRSQELERWGRWLFEKAHQDDLESDFDIRLLEAEGAKEAINHYAGVAAWNDLERWGEELSELGSDPLVANSEQLLGCQLWSIATAMEGYGRSERWADLERWGERLGSLADHGLAGTATGRRGQARAAGVAMTVYGEARSADDLERWGRKLAELVSAKSHPADIELLRIHGSAALYAIDQYAALHRYPDAERWFAILSEIGSHANLPEAESEIPVLVAKGAAIAFHLCGEDQRWTRLESLGRSLSSMTEALGSEIDELWTIMASRCACAMHHYGDHRRWEDLERWGGRLLQIVGDDRFCANNDIRESEALGSFFAASFYGQRGLIADMERWGKRLADLADDPRFCSNATIRFREAEAASNMLLSYGAAGLHGSAPHGSWKRRLAQVAQQFVDNPDIQSIAQHFDLAFVDQVLAHFPYGRTGRLQPQPATRYFKRTRGGTLVRPAPPRPD
ncbi:MAG TPA: hypothetical protein VGW40_03795 [Allosphingosinicella sp.]|nr:hypothetical protein [Allosphingosinicella sp.]